MPACQRKRDQDFGDAIMGESRFRQVIMAQVMLSATLTNLLKYVLVI
jgi:hypothetical protein